MQTKDIVVIGSSSGGISALQELARTLPAELPASVMIVQHLAPDHASQLPQILQRLTSLRVSHPQHGETLQRSCMYVAPPDQHMMLEGGKMLLTRGPKENRSRPSIDVLFRSAAYEYGPRVIGVVLTGTLHDGTAGLWSVKHLGGTAIVQDPHDAHEASMPESALRYVDADHVTAISDLSSLLVRIVATEPSSKLPGSLPAQAAIELGVAKGDVSLPVDVLQLGPPTVFTCPECHGTLMKIEEGKLIRFRCHTGHAYTLESLLGDLAKSVEENLWSALRVMDERLFALRELAGTYKSFDAPVAASATNEQVRALQKRIELIRKALLCS